MLFTDLYSSKDSCPVCGQTPCNCTHLAEAIPYALSAANANAEYERTRTHLGGYKGRVDTEVSGKDEYFAVMKALTRAAKQTGQHVECGLSDNKMSIFSDSMNSDELEEFMDDTLEQGLDEGEVVAFPKKHRGDIGDMHTCPKCGGDLQGGKYMGHQVQVCIPCKQVYLPPNSGIDQQGNKIKEGYSDMMAKERKKRLAAAEKKKQERKLVKDRKTGKMYDPDEQFAKTMNSPEVKAQMKRMATKEGVAEGEVYDLEKEYGYEKEKNPPKRPSAPPIRPSLHPEDTDYFDPVERRLRADQERVRAGWAAHNAKKDVKESVMFEQWNGIGKTLVEYRMSEKQILDLFSRVEAGATAAGQNRTIAGKGKDVATNLASTISGQVKGILNSIQNSTPVQAVDVAYDKATDAVGKMAGGQRGEVMKTIKKYRNLAKEYPKTAGFAKAALVAIAGLATGGAGLPAIAGLTYALDSAIKGDKLSSVLGKGAGAAALAAAAHAATSHGQPGTDTDTSTVTDPNVNPADVTNPAVDPTNPNGWDDGTGTVWGADDLNSYTVMPGETLSSIAQSHGVSVADLKGLNPNIANPDVLQAGQVINIPPENGSSVYAGGTGTSSDTMNQIARGNYPNSPISQAAAAKAANAAGLKTKLPPEPEPGSLAEAIGFVAAVVPMQHIVKRSSLSENVKLKKSVELNRLGVYTVFENIERYKNCLLEARPAHYRPDMPGGPGSRVKPGTIGKGLNWLDKKVGQVGSAIKNFGHQFTTKVTKDKLKMDWHQAGKPSDSDQLAAWLVQQGVPQQVVTDVYGQMGIPYTAPASEPAQTAEPTQVTEPTYAEVPTGLNMNNPETGKPWKPQELKDKWAPQGVDTSGPTLNALMAPAGASPKAAPATDISAKGWDNLQSPEYLGRRAVARKQAAGQSATAPVATPNYAGPTGYGKTTINAPTTFNVPGTAKPTAPATAGAGGSYNPKTGAATLGGKPMVALKDLPPAVQKKLGTAVAEEDENNKEQEADYGDDYQNMVLRLKKLAGAGPLKTVYDPKKRVYKNVPTAVQSKDNK